MREENSILYIVGFIGLVAVVAMLVLSGQKLDAKSGITGMVVGSTDVSTGDFTPRISYWSGKVNQHINTVTGVWETDPDGSSGADFDKLAYCKKWYPNTVSYSEYKLETMYDWKDAGNNGGYASTKQSYKCVSGIVTYVPFLMGFSETAPSSDTVQGVDIASRLLAKGLIPSSNGGIVTGIAKLFGELNAFQLDNQVTLLIYKGAAIIVIGEHSPASHIVFAQELSSILSSKGMTAKTILSSAITSSNLLDLFVITPTCTDTDGGKNVYVAGDADNGDTGTFDGCDFTSGAITVLNEAVCDSNGIPTHVAMTCPTYTPYCNRAICSSSKPKCTDSDNGIMPYVKGTVTEARLAEGPEYTDYCEYTATLQPISQTPALNKCSGGSSCGLREFSCSGVNLNYKDVACPNGCSDGACVNTNSTSAPKVTFTNVIYYKGNQAQDYMTFVLKNIGTDTIDLSKYSLYLDGNGQGVKTLSSSDVLSVGDSVLIKISGSMTAPLFANIHCTSVNGVVLGLVDKTNTYPLTDGTIYSKTAVTLKCIEACTDSDGALNVYEESSWYIKGTTSYNGETSIDACETDIYNHVYLREYHCVSDGTQTVIRGELETCPNGCSNGACISNTINMTGCSDSDGGLNYKIKGFTTNLHNGAVFWDRCDGNILVEQFCDTRDSSDQDPTKLEYKTCINGCSDGACLGETTTCNSTYSKCIQDLGFAGCRAGVNNVGECAVALQGCKDNLDKCLGDTEPGFCTPQNTIYLEQGSKYKLDSQGITYYVSIIGNGQDSYGDYIILSGYPEDGDVETHNASEKFYGHIGAMAFFVKDIFIDDVNGRVATANVCFDMQSDPRDTLTLADYPQPFITEDGIATGLFVVGKKAALEDVIGITDIIANLQMYAGNNPFPVGLVKFDEDISDNQLFNRDVVIVGGMCANTAAEKIYSDDSGFSADCTAMDTPGVGHIKIIRNKNTDKLVLLVHGYSAYDTTMATRVLANWKDYKDAFASTGSLCVTGTLSNMQVKSC